MKTKNTRRKIINKKIIFTASILCAGFFFLKYVYAQTASITELSTGSSAQTDENQEKIAELEKRARIYREIIEIKKRQGESLGNQISIMDTDIGAVQAKIEMNKRKIDELNEQITRISNEIKQKNELIAAQKKLLANLVQTYYQVSSRDLVYSYLANENVATFMTNKDRISQTGDKIGEMLNTLMGLRKELEDKTDDLKNKKTEVVEAHNDLQVENSELEAIKKSKAVLLAQTQGEEAKYAQMLERVEAQKQELLDIDQFFTASGLSVDDYPKPPASLNAPLAWFYSQRDPRWADNNIGSSKSSMKKWGCAVSAVAMVFTAQGTTITPAQLAKKPIFSWDLISWPTSWPEEIVLSGDGYGHGNINWKTIDSSIAKGNPVIVYIKRTKGGGHYVVVHHKEASTGKYVVHDPYFGPNLYLDTSRALVGAMGSSSATSMDQMIIYKK